MRIADLRIADLRISDLTKWMTLVMMFAIATITMVATSVAQEKVDSFVGPDKPLKRPSKSELALRLQETKNEQKAQKPGSEKPGSEKPGSEKPGSEKPGSEKANSAKPEKGDKAKANQKKAPLSQERREELLAFVRENHPELEPLLRQLNKRFPAKYQEAVRSIDRAETKLRAIKDPRRYEMSLQMWKVKSRIQLVSAQLAIKDTPKIRKNLKALIAKQVEMRAKQLEHEASQLQNRLDRVNKQLTEVNDGRDKELERQFEAAVRSANRVRQQQANRIKKKQSDARRQEAKKKNDAKKNDAKSKDAKNEEKQNNSGQ